jgi:hypothetical protein
MSWFDNLLEYLMKPPENPLGNAIIAGIGMLIIGIILWYLPHPEGI